VERIDAVRGARTPQFTVVGDQPGPSGNGGLEHLEPKCRRGFRLIAVNRPGEWNQTDFVEAKGLSRIEGDTQVAVVDRVEGAAEDADRFAIDRAGGRGPGAGERGLSIFSGRYRRRARRILIVGVATGIG
jgi:hypothetical protein